LIVGGLCTLALLCKNEPKSVLKGFASDTEEAQKRMISVTVEQENGRDLTVMNGYFPQGDNINHETKFPYKRQFYKDLMTHLETNHTPDEDVIVMGDINISPTDLDIGIGEVNAKRWLKTGKCSFQPEEREWLAKLLNWGFKDTFREQNPETSDKYSWFDYRSKGFVDNRGLRIDVVLATHALAERCIDTGIDYELRGIEKPSDHAPIWSTFK